MFKNLPLKGCVCDSQHVFSLIVSYSIFFCPLGYNLIFSQVKKKIKLRALFKVTFALLDVTGRVGSTLSLASGDYIYQGQSYYCLW